MKEFMKIALLLLGALVALGCQKKEEAPDSASSAPEVAEPSAEKTAAAEKPEQSEPAPSEPAPEDDTLVQKVMGLMQIRSVEETESGIKITWPVDSAVGITDESKPREVSDAMMFAAFYAAPVLYKRLSELDGLEQVFMYQGKKIGEIRMTRASYEALNVERALQGLPDGKPKREAYRKLLGQLPKGAVEIKKKYRPRA